MKLLNTPEERFDNLPDFPFKPHFIEVDGINIHYLDEGPKQVEVILLMHGEPSWCFLYRHMIPILVKAGFRILAPDLVGFGRSDKPTEQNDHTYLKHVEWMTKWLQLHDLRNITLFCQDWGSLIGLRLTIENQDRFNRIVLSNGGLPTGEQRMSDAFTNWREFSRNSPSFDIKFILQGATTTILSKEVLNGYDAPFPDDSFKAGARILPSLVPISTDDPEHEANKKAIELFKRWKKPFLTAFSDKDPITRGGERFWQALVPGAAGQNHITIKNAGHFVQEDKGPELAELIVEFIKNNP
ncbi:MAG: haloalkane dehalogenase [Promethearchaeota archaeon Loki_b31]|nr:MAG: haloalkane dehalogenase [Candidatus Lokiarchaeota archaeon Loki_b31]